MLIAIEQNPLHGWTIYPARLVHRERGYDLEQTDDGQRADTLHQARVCAWRLARDVRADTVIEVSAV
jgi:hypothetical protein